MMPLGHPLLVFLHTAPQPWPWGAGAPTGHIHTSVGWCRPCHPFASLTFRPIAGIGGPRRRCRNPAEFWASHSRLSSEEKQPQKRDRNRPKREGGGEERREGGGEGGREYTRGKKRSVTHKTRHDFLRHHSTKIYQVSLISGPRSERYRSGRKYKVPFMFVSH